MQKTKNCPMIQGQQRPRVRIPNCQPQLFLLYTYCSNVSFWFIAWSLFFPLQIILTSFGVDGDTQRKTMILGQNGDDWTRDQQPILISVRCDSTISISPSHSSKHYAI